MLHPNRFKSANFECKILLVLLKQRAVAKSYFMIQELKDHYGHTFEEELLNEIAQVGTFKEVPAGYTMMAIGDYIRGVPLLISGAIKVMREDKEGDELLLYYLESGETCSMTMTCCMGHTKSEIKAVAEQDTKLIMVPVQKMEEWKRSNIFEKNPTKFHL